MLFIFSSLIVLFQYNLRKQVCLESFCLRIRRIPLIRITCASWIWSTSEGISFPASCSVRTLNEFATHLNGQFIKSYKLYWLFTGLKPVKYNRFNTTLKYSVRTRNPFARKICAAISNGNINTPPVYANVSVRGPSCKPFIEIEASYSTKKRTSLCNRLQP